MTAALAHRGPDDEGFYQAPGIALGVRRLSIIDVPGGHQPIANEDATVTVAFNGEIYNYQALRARLEGQGHRFRSRSDTEVLVHLYEEYGDALVHLLQGMFAFALWDTKRHRLLLARDRLGIKPLYYTLVNDTVVFASEAKALFRHPGVRPEIDLDALDAYLSLRYVPGPDTLFRGVKKLPPGHTAVFENGQLTIRRYWDIVLGDYQSLSLDEAAEQFAALLADTVHAHLVSDVPVGVLLSGGLDSAAVAALAGPTKTFTVGFSLPGAHNELAEARETARCLGTDHHELVLEPDAAELLPKLAWHMDEPVADPAALPTYLICCFARQHVPVVLTGEGGDELLGGYPRYTWFARAKALQRATPRWARAGALALSRLAPLGARYHTALDNLLADRGDVDRHLHWVPGLSPELRAQLTPHWPLATSHFLDPYFAPNGADTIHRLMRLDFKTWLVDDVLTKMDRMSMATSVEARVPLLDHRLVEFAATLPLDLNLAHGPKTLLKRALADRLPPGVLRRRKHAFQIPLRQWLDGPLHDFVRGTLLDKRARERGWLDTTRLEMLLGNNGRKRAIDGQSVWTLLTLELWARAFLD
jgi:asparagine synthase (glutamine-hydrolysing)